MKKTLLLFSLSLCFISGFESNAQAPDWSSKIADIIYSNCTSCHREGGIGPFELMTYQDAFDNAFSIQSYVNSGKMPPWPPAADCSYQLKDDRRLGADDITAINDWVTAGAPSGDLGTAPAPPIFNSNTQLDEIDQTVQLPNYYVQLATDEYRTFVIPSGYTSAGYLNQIEVVPGNNAIVHHVLVYYDPTSAAYDLDQQDPLPGFSTNGTNTPSPSAIMIGGWAPGTQADKLPYNMAYEVPANADFVVEVHYASESQGQLDSTKINLKFCDHPSPRLMSVQPVLFHYFPSLTNGPFVIPANTIKTFNEKSVGFVYDVNGDYSLYSVLPHMHMIGKSVEVYMTKTGSTDTTRLVCIPDWSFHWQLGYVFHNLIRWNPGENYTLRASATYDNTANNPNNPSNPPVQVVLGESTLDEMMVVFFSFLEYQPGDEDIILDETTGIPAAGNAALPVILYPNPANDRVELSAWLPGNDLKVELMNSLGASVKLVYEGNQPKGAYATSFDISDLPDGIYFIELKSGGERTIQKLVKTK